jgi:hypothetical protein
MSFYRMVAAVLALALAFPLPAAFSQTPVVTRTDESMPSTTGGSPAPVVLPVTPLSPASGDAYTYQASNGYLVAVHKGRENDIATGIVQSPTGETMTVSIDRIKDLLFQVSVDGSLDLEYSYRRDGQELAQDTFTVSYGGRTYSGPPMRSWRGYSPYPAGGAINLIRGALADLHGPAFYSGAGDALAEAMEANLQGSTADKGVLACIAAVMGYIGSLVTLYFGCASIFGCIGAIVLHDAATVGLICSCIVDC